MSFRIWKILPFALALLATCAAYINLEATPRGRPDPRFVQPDQIDPSEGVKILQAFRSARTAGDYVFDFQLINRPYKGKKRIIDGQMAGSWNANTESLTRSDLHLSSGATLHLLYKGGLNGAIYKAENDDRAIKIEDEALYEPIVEGLTFTPFELQMPFLFWDDYVYEGTRKLLGRPAHYFILYPPQDFESPTVGAVRVAIDADFLVMLMAEELDENGNTIKEFRINGFKKVDEQWIVKEIDLIDEKTKDRTRLKVVSADVGITLPKSLFEVDENGKLSPIYQ